MPEEKLLADLFLSLSESRVDELHKPFHSLIIPKKKRMSESFNKPSPVFITPQRDYNSEGNTYFVVYLDEKNAREILRLMDLADQVEADSRAGASISVPFMQFGSIEATKLEKSLKHLIGDKRVKDFGDRERHIIVDESSLELQRDLTEAPAKPSFEGGSQMHLTRAPTGERVAEIQDWFLYNVYYRTYKSDDDLRRAQVLYAYMRTAPEVELPNLLRRLAEEDPHLLLKGLREPLRFEGEPEEQGRNLLPHCPQEVLSTLLQHSDAQVRQEAICLSGQVAREIAEEVVQAPAASRRRS